VFAKVVVDVPDIETDRPFDYIVPPDLSDWVFVGSRVVVPFGNRPIQGYVIELTNTSEIERLKSIKDILDPIPPLTEEMVRLGIWISKRYVCRLYSALQAMLPAALRSNYQKKVFLSEKAQEQLFLLANEQEIFHYIHEHKGVEWEELNKRFPGRRAFLLRSIKEGMLEVDRGVKDRVTKKKVLVVRPVLSKEELAMAARSLPKAAGRQREILEKLVFVEEEIVLKELLTELGVSHSSIKSLAAKGMIILEEREERRDPYEGRQFSDFKPISFTGDQQNVMNQVRESLEHEVYSAFLLHGVTGSGKTEVYLEMIAKCLELGKEAIVLVPEISLTPQMVHRFKGRFGNQVAVLHSRLSHGERYDEWRMIREGKVKVAVGARSAIFAPFTKLGLIIIDEEHESSYKQEETPRYHARDICLMRASFHQAAAIFGSATPAMESYYKATKGNMALLSMPNRVANRPLPTVQIIDMRAELRDGNRSMFSQALTRAITERLARKEQMVLFLNRRGFSTFVMCRSCGYVMQCPHCDISLTYHRYNQTVRCHYCGYAEKEPKECPNCHSTHIRFFGTGTQKVEEELGRHFPGVRVIRMDVDTTSQKGSHEKLLTSFRQGQADILLGTQMIAKGLDFPKVTLVGVIAADTTLGMPDFRAAERTFQLLTQVAGRAGRHELPGEVVIQTYNPEHYSVLLSKEHDYFGFFAQEAKHRFKNGYPPYYKLILFTFTSENVPLIVKKADEWVKVMRRELPSSVYLLGPVASPIPRIKDRYRFQCMLKYRDEREVLPFVKKMADRFTSHHKKDEIQLTVDVDPQMLM
jgi:primosomal protein N' (replication factor Y) (superfamily II helicase)